MESSVLINGSDEGCPFVHILHYLSAGSNEGFFWGRYTVIAPN